MNTANKLTILRVFMIPVFLLVLYLDVPNANYWALAIFVIASLTDTLDGYIARHYNQTTDFGKFMDPLADKCLVTAAMLFGQGQDRLHHGVHRAHVPAHPGGAEPGLCGGDRGHHHLLRRGVFCQKPGRDLGDQVKSVQAGPYKRPCPFLHKNFRNCAAFSPGIPCNK